MSAKKSTTFTVSSLAKSMKIAPKVARRRLRTADVHKPKAGWEFPMTQKAKIVSIIKH